jgi:hypothetical protein
MGQKGIFIKNMTKQASRPPQIVKLCRAFISALDEKAAIFGFKPVEGSVNWTDDKVISYLKTIFTDNHKGFHFPTVFRAVADQNEVSLRAMESSGITFDEARRGLKNEGLESLVTLLGRAARLG